MKILEEVARDCACRRARMAARKVTRAYDEALRPVGLKITQFTLLVAIGQGRPASISSLAEWLAMERTTLTRNLQLLERERLIELGPEGTRRTRAMTLTEKGRDVLERALPRWRTAQDRLEERLGPERWAETRDRLTDLVRSA